MCACFFVSFHIVLVFCVGTGVGVKNAFCGSVPSWVWGSVNVTIWFLHLGHHVGSVSISTPWVGIIFLICKRPSMWGWLVSMSVCHHMSISISLSCVGILLHVMVHHGSFHVCACVCPCVFSTLSRFFIPFRLFWISLSCTTSLFLQSASLSVVIHLCFFYFLLSGLFTLAHPRSPLLLSSLFFLSSFGSNFFKK